MPIPGNLLGRIDELDQCKLIETNMESINISYRELLDNISASRSFKGISPIFDPYYPEFFLSMAKREIPVSIILTSSSYKNLEKNHACILQEYIACDNARLYIVDNVKLTFLATEKFVAILFYKIDGEIDPFKYLISFKESSIRWGEELFEYYRLRSQEILVSNVLRSIFLIISPVTYSVLLLNDSFNLY